MVDLLTRLADLPPAVIYVIAFTLIAGETAVLLGLLPAEATLLLVGFLSFQGTLDLLDSTLALMVLAAVIGDSLAFRAGRRYGHRLREGRWGERVGAARWAKAEGMLHRLGGRGVLGARFVAFARTLLPRLAGAVAETEAALRDVKAGITVTTVKPIEERPERRWWLGAAAAAALVGIVAVGAVVLTREDPDTLSSAAPDTTVGTTVSTAAPAPDAGAPLSEPPTLTESDAQVLYETTVGAELGQLGVQDELRPLAPIVAPNGDLILGDPVNHRWILVREGETLSVDYDDNEFVWDAVLGVDEFVYSLIYNGSTSGLVNGSVNRQSTDFTGTGGYDTNVGDCCRRLVYDGSFENGGPPEVTDDAVVIQARAGAPTILPGEPSTVTAQYLDGTTRTWSVPAIQLTLPPESHALANGELVLLQRFANPQTVTWAVRLLRLDGTVATELITLSAEPDDNIGKLSVGADGLTMLQRVDESTFRALRFPLPTAVFVDPVPTTVVVDETVVATEVATTIEVQPTVSTVVIDDTVVSTEAPTTTEMPPTTASPIAPAGTVLYEASVGAGEGQLGLQDCQECEPLAPMVAPDGSLIIVDFVNRRWVIVRDGVESYVDYPEVVLLHDAVLGRDGDVYWVENGVASQRVMHAPIDNLAAPTEMIHPVVNEADTCCRTIGFDGSGEPAVEDPTLTLDENNNFLVRQGLLEPTLSATMDDDGGSTVVATYVDGSTQSWTLGISGLDPQLPTLHVVPGTDLLVAIQTAPLSVEAAILHFVNVLYPDGTMSTVNLPPGVTTAGSAGHWSITPDGVTTLVFDDEAQLFQVIRYPLPS